MPATLDELIRNKKSIHISRPSRRGKAPRQDGIGDAILALPNTGWTREDLILKSAQTTSSYPEIKTIGDIPAKVRTRVEYCLNKVLPILIKLNVLVQDEFGFFSIRGELGSQELDNFEEEEEEV